MKLPISLPFQKQESSHYYLALILTEDKTHAVIFEEEMGKIHVVGEHAALFSHSIELISEEEWLQVLDKAISTAESKLPEGYETRKTVFAVKENWIDETKIKKEYLAKLKKACDALGLTPIGFLVLHEAITHLLQQEEGAPVSAVLVEAGVEEVAISILRAGKILETKRTPLTETLAKTIDKMLHHFTSFEILPSRIIVFNSKDHEKVSQELITYQWSKSLPFLHVPQITILPNRFDAKAVLFGAATQMGFTVAEGDFLEKHNGETQEKPGFDTPLGDNSFGFMQEEDIAKKRSDETEEPKEPILENNISTFSNDFYEQEHEENKPVHGRIHANKNMTAFLLPLKVTLARLFQALPNASFAQKSWFFLIPPALLSIVIGVSLFYIFSLKATVVVHIDPKTVEETKSVAFSTTSATDVSGTIAAETLSVSEDGSLTTPATGKKEVGDKAKGSITLYNSTTKQQTIDKGTSITSSNNLQFTLDDSVKIASSSGASDGPKTAKIEVSAKDIGKEYNLPSGTKFTVSGLSSSDVEAKNDTAFEGGSKKEVTVVANADINKLTTDLPNQLAQKAREDVKTKASGKELLPTFLSSTLTKKTFDKKVGDGASSVTLNATVSYTAAAYKKDDLVNFSLETISKDNPSLAAKKENLSYSLEDIKQEKENISSMLHIKAGLMPKLNTQTLANELAGKSFDSAKTLLTNQPQVKDVTITLHPSFPFLPNIMPRMAKNITVTVKTNE